MNPTDGPQRPVPVSFAGSNPILQIGRQIYSLRGLTAKLIARSMERRELITALTFFSHLNSIRSGDKPLLIALRMAVCLYRNNSDCEIAQLARDANSNLLREIFKPEEKVGERVTRREQTDKIDEDVPEITASSPRDDFCILDSEDTQSS